jgi:hypothetical protein
MATEFPSRKFNRNISRTKPKAGVGPVIVADCGKRAQGGPGILELLDQPEGADIEFDPPRLGGIFRSQFEP